MNPNFRNGGKLVENPDEDSKDNRYVTLMKKLSEQVKNQSPYAFRYSGKQQVS